MAEPVEQLTPLVEDIPDKLYFRIGEVARLTGVKQYVLRFWENEFPGLGPKKSGSGHRLFRRKDVEMVLEIKRLLYDKRFTIEGARKALESRPKPLAVPKPTKVKASEKKALQQQQQAAALPVASAQQAPVPVIQAPPVAAVVPPPPPATGSFARPGHQPLVQQQAALFPELFLDEPEPLPPPAVAVAPVEAAFGIAPQAIGLPPAVDLTPIRKELQAILELLR